MIRYLLAEGVRLWKEGLLTIRLGVIGSHAEVSNELTADPEYVLFGSCLSIFKTIRLSFLFIFVLIKFKAMKVL